MNIPSDSIKIPNNPDRDPYMTVWMDDTRLYIHLQNGVEHTVSIDSMMLPHLVDALIELQNR